MSQVPFRKVLIANRGEIAVRVAHALRQMDIISVAVFSAADRDALHVRVCDEAVAIGPGPAPQSYLRGDVIVAAARAAAADAVHPGYGFLAESAAFAEQVAAAGLVFIGPPPAAMRTMGSKTAARRAMQAAGVPCVPGTSAAPADLAAARAAADQVGFPLMLKAAAGGGGRGMRRVADPEALALSWSLARKEAAAAFGDDTLYLERALVRPRHIEVQVFAEADGHVWHLGERECSLQRRHQKVIEEAPAAHLAAAAREQLLAVACRAARAVDYRGAGTVEFLLEDAPAGGGGPNIYFLEMNTRLQVEHPVTEMVWGVDLVEAQVYAAAGLPSPWRQAPPRPRGHAIEARLCAEDPAADFAPSPGLVRRLRWPQAPGVRVEAGVAEGIWVSPFYDPLLGKIVAWGRDREQARRRLLAALAATSVAGIAHNLAYLRALVAMPAFAAGRYHTGSAAAGPAAAGRPPPAEACRLAVTAAALAAFRRETASTKPVAAAAAADQGGAWRRGAAGGPR